MGRRASQAEQEAAAVGRSHRPVRGRGARGPRGLRPGGTPRFGAAEAATEPEFEQGDGYIRVTAIAVSDEETDAAREAVVVDCFIGENWVVTAHAERDRGVDDFRTSPKAAVSSASLDAPSFLATLLEWVVTSYSRAFAEVEVALEKFDLSVLRGSVARGGGRNAEQQISHLVEIRGRVGRLRRALTPHREIFATLGHPELDLISTGVVGRAVREAHRSRSTTPSPPGGTPRMPSSARSTC